MLSRRVVAVVCVVLASCAVARAQSAEDGFNPGANGNVYDMVVQPDGKILVGGTFTGLGSGTGATARSHLGRLNPDGTVDPGFNPGTNGEVNALVLQPDGKIVVGGNFNMLGGAVRQFIGRLNADGSVDEDFHPDANNIVFTLALQPDGKILVGGIFATLGGGARNRIGRLNPNGSLDTSFNPGANDFVYAFAFEPGGRILAVGAFTTIGGGGSGLTPRSRIARLNADGSVDASFNPGANDWALAVVPQPDGRILVGGDFTMIGGGGTGATSRNHLARLNPDGSLDTSFDPNANDFVVTIALQADGRILVGGGFTALGGAMRTSLARLRSDGAVDVSWDTGANGYVYALPVQADGSILVGGNFTALTGHGAGAINHIARISESNAIDRTLLGGVEGAVVYGVAVQGDGKIVVGGNFGSLGGAPTRNFMGRLTAEGAIDAMFNPGANSSVFSVAIQPDGKILVGGLFTTLGGAARSRIGRLNADGSLDTSFDAGANDRVFATATQPDGKILVGGRFTMLGGGLTGLNARIGLGRIFADGSIDAAFNPGADGYVSAVALQPDGKILIGGDFTMIGNGAMTARSRLARLNADGSVDTSFDPGANNVVNTVVLQPDGKILVGGYFTMIGGGGTGQTPRNRIVRLNADGAIDATFNPGAGANEFIQTLAVQADGNIVVGGGFTALSDMTVGFSARGGIGRFTADGALDFSFIPGSDGFIFALAIQADGKIVAGGSFSKLGGGGSGTSMRPRIGRLTNTAVARQTLSVTSGGSIITWSRSGAGPELSSVTFESSVDGVTYVPLGRGTRVPGGWRLSGLSLPAKQNVYIRARGFYGTGVFNGSTSVVESVALKTYQRFSDDPLTAASSPIRVVHLTELRTRIDVLRVRFGLATFAWTNASLTAGMTAAAAHVSELRTALQQAYTAAGQPVPTFTESPLVPGSTSIKVVHLHELRDAVIVLEAR